MFRGSKSSENSWEQLYQGRDTKNPQVFTNYHHLATLDPARANPKPLAPSKQPNMVVTTSKYDRKKENKEEKHLLGVLREEEQQGLEML